MQVPRRQFEFQKLDVYRVALVLHPKIVAIAKALPRGYGDLRNQLLRAERSIRLNIAEGAGKKSPGGKAERYRTARGSTNEVAACLDEVELDGLVPAVLIHEAFDLLHRLVAMLTRLVIVCEERR